MSVSARLDAYQRTHTWLGLPIAVIYKFVDDQGGYLAALITYYGFLSLFPLLLLAVTILGFVISNHPHLQSEVIGSALAQFPIVGKQIQTDIHGYTGSGAGLAVGLIGAVYGGLGVAQAGQNALNIAWAVPRNSRPNPLRSRLRSAAIVTALGVGIVITTVVSALVAGAHPFGIGLDPALRVVATFGAGLINIALFVAGYRYVTVERVSVRDVAVGAVVAGVAWEILQSIGAYYIAHKLKGAREVYGVFAVVLGIIAWIYIEALIVVICAELNVVLCRRLWPRALLTPFTDNVSLTPADETAYDSYARAQRHKGFENIEVDFRGGDRSDPTADGGADTSPPVRSPGHHDAGDGEGDP
jgi:YihY family inner membrane protein